MKFLEQFLLNHPQLIQPSLGQHLRTAMFAVFALCAVWMSLRLSSDDLAPSGAPLPKWALNCFKVGMLAGFVLMVGLTFDSWNGRPNLPIMSTPLVGVISFVGLLGFVVGIVKALKVTWTHSHAQKSESKT